jgi:predicted TIM-barrel fold metal-dependent hydrolase
MVIDYSVTPPTKEFLVNPDYLKDYRKIYQGRGQELKKQEEWTAEMFIDFLEKEEIDIAVIKARDIETTLNRKIPNEACADLVKKYPKKLIGMAGVDPFKGKAAVQELEYAIKELGLKGVNLWPYEYNIYAHDRTYYPIYEKCQELGAIVSIETSIHFRRAVRMDLCRPLYLDYVAVDFPNLTLVGSTPGWPWVAELMGVAWRHPNVYIATSVVRPKHFGNPISGYETLIQFGNTLLQDRIIYGSGWPTLPMKRGAEEVKALPLKEDVKAKWLYHNAARLFGLE